MLLALLAGVLVFFALTRTQVGRDGLRRQIERSFDSRYKGSLQIRQLKGNLLNDLYASDVSVYDAGGELVFTIDSLIVRPQWTDLFDRQFSVRSMVLVGPRFLLTRGATGHWNVEEAFQPVSKTVSTERVPWKLATTSLRVIDGVIRTRNMGDAPKPVVSGLVFDYSNSELRNIQARASVEWRSGYKLIDVLSLSGYFPAIDFSARQFEGQFILRTDRVSVNRLILQTDRNRINVSAALRSGDGSPLSLSDALVRGRIRRSHLDFNEIRKILPGIPLGSEMEVSARFQGKTDSLAVYEVALQSGRSQVAGHGLFRGLPDSLGFNVRLSESTLESDDLAALLPELDFSRLNHLGPIDFSLLTEGGIRSDQTTPEVRLWSNSRIELQADAGKLNGLMRFVYDGGNETAYRADVSIDGLDVGRIVDDRSLSTHLNGRIHLRGAGFKPADMQGEAHAWLGPSTILGRNVDSLRLDVTRSENEIDATSYGRINGGSALVKLRADVGGADRYALNARFTEFDLGGLTGMDSLTSAINARVTVRGSGYEWKNIEGRWLVDIDSSWVRHGSTVRTVAPHHTGITFALPAASSPRITLDGDIATGHIDGFFGVRPAIALGRLWGEAVADAAYAQYNKPYGGEGNTPSSLPDDEIEAPAILSGERIRDSAANVLQAVGADSAMTVVADLRILRSDLLTSLLPMLPQIGANLSLQTRLQADGQRVRMDGRVAADSFRVGALRLDSLAIDVRAIGNLDADLAESMMVDVEGKAGQFQLAEYSLRDLNVKLTFGGLTGRIAVDALQRRNAGPLRFTAALNLLPDRNLVTLLELHATTGDYSWSSPEQGIVELYSDAVVVPGITLEGKSRTMAAPQRVRIDGAISQSGRDTLSARAEGIVLQELSKLFSFKYSLGGFLDGRVALTGAISRPDLAGSVQVQSLAFDDRVLGDLAVTGAFSPGSPLVNVDLMLRPVQANPSPGETGRILRNDVRLTGALLLPETDSATPVSEGLGLDFHLKAARADVFFLEHIFNSEVTRVAGYLTGEGDIGGTLTNPLFEGRFSANDIQFEVPDFNLAISGQGAVVVDREGLHIDEALFRDRTGGTAELKGSLLFNQYRFFSLDLTGRLDRFQILNVTDSRDLAFYGKIWASGNASLAGPLYNATLQSSDIVTAPESEIYIPLTETGYVVDPGFIIFADSTGNIPDLAKYSRRQNVLANRPVGERVFTDGLDMDLNIFAPPGSTVHLVIDPLLGDQMNAVGSGRIQFRRKEGEYTTFGALEVTSGDYLFTAGDVFFRRFLIDGGTITWDGNPVDALLDVSASYRTRASREGLPDEMGISATLIPLIVHLDVTGRVSSPAVDLRLAFDRDNRDLLGGSLNYQILETMLNQPERSAEMATSVLLTNSFLLTASSLPNEIDNTSTRNQFAFNSVSQLVASQVNRYLSRALPNLDLNFGVQGADAQDLDVTYGVALRLLDERVVIRGQGVYQRGNDLYGQSSQGGVLPGEIRNQGEFVVEVRLNSAVSVEVFYRREGDVLSDATLTNTTGAGVSYQTQFVTWKRLLYRVLGLKPRSNAPESPPPEETAAGGLP